ncbi:MAG: hypothetical protein ACP5QO_12090 [Clostridia bacterium]
MAERPEPWRDAWHAALQEWREARAAFDEAEEPFIDFQALRLRAAEEKLSLLLRLMREQPDIHPYRPKKGKSAVSSD